MDMWNIVYILYVWNIPSGVYVYYHIEVNIYDNVRSQGVIIT